MMAFLTASRVHAHTHKHTTVGRRGVEANRTRARAPVGRTDGRDADGTPPGSPGSPVYRSARRPSVFRCSGLRPWRTESRPTGSGRARVPSPFSTPGGAEAAGGRDGFSRRAARRPPPFRNCRGPSGTRPSDERAPGSAALNATPGSRGSRRSPTSRSLYDGRTRLSSALDPGSRHPPESHVYRYTARVKTAAAIHLRHLLRWTGKK